MEVYKHLINSEGEESAKRLVHWMYSYLKLGNIKPTTIYDLMDIKEMVPMIGYQGALDELAYLYRQGYPLEDFLKDVSEDKFDNIIMDFEIWDKRSDEEKFWSVIRTISIHKGD